MLGDPEGQVDMVEKVAAGHMPESGDNNKVIRLRLPLTDESVLSLRAGDIVSLSGAIITGRDRAHKYLFEQRPSKASAIQTTRENRNETLDLFVRAEMNTPSRMKKVK